VNVRLTKADYLVLAARRKRALMSVAEQLGKEHALTKMMDCMAWGRSAAEQTGSGTTLQTAVAEWAYLVGAYDVLNTWARDNDIKGQIVLVKAWSAHRCDSYSTTTDPLLRREVPK